MTLAEVTQYYVNLLIAQYAEKPNAASTIAALIGPVLMGDSVNTSSQLPLEVLTAFDLTSATPASGAQLDILGDYAGVSRTGQGFTGSVTLTDADFMKLIQMAVIRNNSGSSLAAIQNLLAQFFPSEILVFDYQNMHMSYLISSTVGSVDLVQLFVNEGLLPKPMGVQLGAVIYAPIINAFFGMTDARVYELTLQVEPNASPFNTGQSYQMNWPWLNAMSSIGPSYQQSLTTESGATLDTESGVGIELE